MLSRDQILSASDLTFEEVNVPEWGGKVRVRTLTAGERDKFEALMFSKEPQDRGDYRATLVALCAVDENGNRIFEDKDVPELSKKSAKAVNRVYNAATRVNLLSVDDQKELEKN